MSDFREVIFKEINEMYPRQGYDNLYVLRPSYGIPTNVSRHQTYVWLATKRGLMGGYSETDNKFQPYYSLTRVDALIILDRILEPSAAE